MKDFDALKNIWHGQPETSKLAYDDLLRQVKAAGSSFAAKLRKESIAMGLVILIFLLIWILKPFEMWTSHLSLLLFIACCFYYIFVQYNDYKSISNSTALLHQPEHYINYLKTYKRERYLFNSRNYLVYSLFIGLAFALYFIEVYFSAPKWQTIGGALFTVAWFIACGFFMRVYVRREQERLQEMIEKLERLKNQFREDES